MWFLFASPLLGSGLINPDKRYDPIWGDAAREWWGENEIWTAGSLQIGAFEQTPLYPPAVALRIFG